MFLLLKIGFITSCDGNAVFNFAYQHHYVCSWQRCLPTTIKYLTMIPED